MKVRRVRIGVMALLSFWIVQAPAWGGELTQSDKATARALFEEGKSLAAAARHSEACVKLEESQKLDPGVGTMFHLADCFEHVGKTTSAWSLYLEVAQRMSAAGQKEREQAARDRAKALEPKLSRLTISLASEASALQGLVVRRDGANLSRGVWGSAIPVDPGAHLVEATAPGRKPWSRTVDVAGNAARISVEIPMLEPEASAAPSAAAAPGPIVATNPRRDAAPEERGQGPGTGTIGLIVAGAGVVGLGVGIGLALGAKSKFNDSDPYCNGNRCTQQGVDLRDEAVSRADTATIVSGIGLAAAVGGVVLFLAAPSGAEPGSTAGAMPVIAIGPGSIQMTGRF